MGFRVCRLPHPGGRHCCSAVVVGRDSFACGRIDRPQQSLPQQSLIDGKGSKRLTYRFIALLKRSPASILCPQHNLLRARMDYQENRLHRRGWQFSCCGAHIQLQLVDHWSKVGSSGRIQRRSVPNQEHGWIDCSSGGQLGLVEEGDAERGRRADDSQVA